MNRVALVLITAAVISLGLLPGKAFSASACTAESTATQCLCSGAEPDAATFLPDVRKSAMDVRRALCIQGATKGEVLDAFIDFARTNRDWFEPFGGFADGKQPLQATITRIQNSDGENVDVAALSINIAALLLGGNTFKPASETICSQAAGGEDCEAVLEEFADLYNYAQATYAAPAALTAARSFSALRVDWDNYLNQSRGQTPLELLINSTLFKRNEPSHFAAPPDKQWIVLHPSLVVENVSNAIDGENTQEALAVEVIGVNWWRQDKWYVPSGASLVTVYSDRPGIEDWGYGVALHFKSVYTLGATSHDGKNGVFISFDLLKLLQDKDKIFASFAP